MPGLLNKYLTMVFLLICIFTGSSGQEIRFRPYNMNSGLSHNSGLALLQDRDGYIWIGTRDGLNRFDGIDFILFRHNFFDSLSLSNNQVNCLLEGSDNCIWIGTANGLNRFRRETGKFERFMNFPDSTGAAGNYIRAMCEVPGNKIWVSTTTGISVYDLKTSIHRNFLINPVKSHPSNTVVSIFSEADNPTLFGTRGGLFVLKDGLFQRIILDRQIELQNDRFEIRDIRRDPEGTYWVATEGFGLYLFKLDPGGLNPVSLKRYYTGNCKIASDFIRKIFLSPDETAWIGTLDGVSLFNKKDSVFTNAFFDPDNPQGINDNSIRDILRDRTGGYWIGTYAGGVNYYHPQNSLFPHYKKNPGDNNSLSDNAISDFKDDNKGNLWIATERGGLNYWDIKNNRFFHYKHSGVNSIPDDNVKELEFDRKGNLWIGTYNGLSVLNPQTGQFSNYLRSTGSGNSINHNQVHALYSDRDDQLWIGTNGGGLQMLSPDRHIFTSFPWQGRENVNVITEDKSGKLWIGSQNGLFCMERETRKEVDLTNLLKEVKNPVIYIQCLLADSTGNIWVGTQGYGLYLISKNRMYWFNMLKGLPDNTVNAILEENRKSFWMTTNQGISNLTLSNDSSGEPILMVKKFTSGHGIQGKQFYPRSGLKSGQGQLFFGGINGFNAFYPADIKDTVFFPEILFTGVNTRSRSSENLQGESLLEEPFKSITGLRLKYNQRDISISFIGINYINPEGTFYRYKMQGLDGNWNDLGNKREINFAYLPVGTYQLQIKASTDPDSWGDAFKAISITVLPPWYLTVYASIFYVAFVGFLLLVFFRYSQKWARLKNDLAMEHFQREKEEELHQMKLKFFTDVSHELRTPLTLITAPLEQITNQPDLSNRLRNQLLSIQRNSQRMIHLINKVLDLRKLETGHGKLQVSDDNIVEFLKETCLAFQESARVKNIKLEFSSPFDEQLVWYDREKLEIILFNLLSNAIKFTGHEGKVNLSFNLIRQGGQTGLNSRIINAELVSVISVEDNGEGIAENKLDTIFKRFYKAGTHAGNNAFGSGVGLELTKRLVELHKGTIKAESRTANSLDSGFTRFTVYLPASRADYSEDEMDNRSKELVDTSRYLLRSIEDSGEVPDNSLNHSSVGLNPGTEGRLLIIEDSEDLRKFLSQLFEKHFIVDEAENGKAGWNLAVKKIPDLIISDVMMPEMNGIDLCRKIKTDIRTSHIPVILLTARTAITYKYEGLETGADDYITKPFTTEYLIIRVNNLIRQRELMRNHFVNEMICNPAKVTVTSIDEKLLKKAVDYITENISVKTISVEKLSAEIGLSRVHFYRKIKALTNLTALEFIRSIRLKRAASLLEQKKLSVKEVADMAGFQDPEYFSKLFKTNFGVLPSDYTGNSENNTTAY